MRLFKDKLPSANEMSQLIESTVTSGAPELDLNISTPKDQKIKKSRLNIEMDPDSPELQFSQNMLRRIIEETFDAKLKRFEHL